MSYSISYRREVRWIPHPDPYYGKLFFCLEEIGDNNVYEVTGRQPSQERRARDWTCVVADNEINCWSKLAERSAACPGGSLKLAGSRRWITPEGYLRSWRTAFKKALPLLDEPRLEAGRLYWSFDPKDHADWEAAHRWKRQSLRVQAFTRIMDGLDNAERDASLEKLQAHPEYVPVQGTTRFDKEPYTQWNWDLQDAEQVRLWLDTRQGQSGWQYCETFGHNK